MRFEPAASEVKGKCANHLATEAPTVAIDEVDYLDFTISTSSIATVAKVTSHSLSTNPINPILCPFHSVSRTPCSTPGSLAQKGPPFDRSSSSRERPSSPLLTLGSEILSEHNVTAAVS